MTDSSPERLSKGRKSPNRAEAHHGRFRAFRFSSRFCTLRRQAARVPKKAPADVKTHIVMVTALSLVVNIPRLPVETKMYFSDFSTIFT